MLTGGRSSRLGRSKADLFLRRIVAAASPVFTDVIAVQKHGEASIRTILDDSHSGDAPVFGVIRALEHAGGRCFILATDYPLLTTEILRELREAFLESQASLFVPVWRSIPQVLCAGYSAALLPVIRQRVLDGKLDLHGLLEVTDAVTMEVSGDMWLNVNTPADLERLT